MNAYPRTLQYLFGLKRLGVRPGPEVTETVLHALGDPHRTYSTIHITGSKGKGSTSALCASVLQRAGLRTGLYTSPHLLSFRERAQVDGEPVTPQELVEGVSRVRRTFERLLRQGTLDREPTFFEVATVFAFDHFRRRGVEVAVVEVGLGGRLDATNVLHAPVTAVTTLELEHTELLGPTIQDIAREKAGIFHRDAWAVTGVSEGAGLEALRHHAFQLGVPLWVLGHEVKVRRRGLDLSTGRQRFDVETPLRSHPDLELGLRGAFQVRNAAVALAALDLWSRAQHRPLPDEAFRTGLAAAVWPARLQQLESAPPFYVDGAHTPESAREVAEAIRELHPSARPSESTLLFSCLSDKKPREILQELQPLATHLVLFPLGAERAMSLPELEESARGRFAQVLLAKDVREAVHLARLATDAGGILLALGGLYLAGAVIAEVEGIPPEGPDLADPLPRSGMAKLWGDASDTVRASARERSAASGGSARNPAARKRAQPRRAGTSRRKGGR